MCGEVIEETKTVPTSFIEKAICKTQNFYILLAFFLITVALFIASSIYCYLVKYWANQKDLLPFHVTVNKLMNVL